MIEADQNVDVSDREEWYGYSFEDKLEILKATVTVPEVAQLMGLEADEGDKITSPWNLDERTPSCHLYDDHFFDYGTGRWGDIFDMVIAMNPGTELREAVKAIWERAVSVGKEYGDVEHQQPRELLDFTADLEPYTPTTPVLGIPIPGGWALRDNDGNLFVPHREPGRVYGVKTRWASGGKGSWAGSQYSHRLYDPFGWFTVATSDLAVICEGESDCWAMTHALMGQTVDVYALPSGVGTWRDHWLDDLKPYRRILVCMDNDRAGKAATDKLMLKIGYGRAETLRVPQLYDDARAAIGAGWRPET